MRLTVGSRRVTSRDLQVAEATEELLNAEVPEPDGVASDVSLLRGFNATIPSSEKNRTRRRQMRNVDVPKVGLKKIGLHARGLLEDEEADDVQSVASEDDVVVVGPGRRKGKRKARESLSTTKILGKSELTRQAEEISKDKENLHVRRVRACLVMLCFPRNSRPLSQSLIQSEISEIENKIKALDLIREQLEGDLLKIQEDELELDDELEGVRERLQFEDQASNHRVTTAQVPHVAPSRRRKGPVFLPSEHDELPPAIAFMTLESHLTPITALDFSEPYGTIGHRGEVKCIQVEDNLCLTGSQDGSVRLWDLRWSSAMLPEEDGSSYNDGELIEKPNGIRSNTVSEAGTDSDGPCVRIFDGHSKAVTALYFEDECLVTGASDKTLRQWDLSTGQCVLTMDILWAMSHSQVAPLGSQLSFPGAAAAAGSFADGSWDMYQDFVGGVQFWGYGLVSGSGDGAVRMWDMRTGQTHRTLLGHTEPITCLQFDEIHIVSGSLDKSVRIWDVRAGAVFETLKYDHGVTALQFDTRKVVAATGENGVKIYNRTTMQHSTLVTNGHTRPVGRLRYMDRYLASGGRDSAVKIWTL
ncbi:WD40-repeat-containing domain protein [Melanogaster broomeanus]|nr:WD40-repeat-containing domain protein [Melanogaster broomeanus]